MQVEDPGDFFEDSPANLSHLTDILLYKIQLKNNLLLIFKELITQILFLSQKSKVEFYFPKMATQTTNIKINDFCNDIILQIIM